MSEYFFNDIFLYAGFFCVALAAYWIWNMKRQIKKEQSIIQRQSSQQAENIK